MIVEASEKLEIGSIHLARLYEHDPEPTCMIKVVREASLEEYIKCQEVEDPFYEDNKHLYQNDREGVFYYEVSAD